MPEVSGRLRAVAAASLSALMLVVLVVPGPTQAADPPRITRFMAALGAIESNGRYDAVNTTSGAIGKYQIMAANWASWSLRYLGNASAAPTPRNQDYVARHKLTALYNWLGDWPSVAHWWLTGDGERDPARWSAGSRRYVDKVMGLMNSTWVSSKNTSKVAVPAKAPAVPIEVFDESSRYVHFSGGWRQAEFARYNGGMVRYAVDSGKTAWFTFQGTSITWIGPVGPTRGKANVYLDEVMVATVDAYARHFNPRAAIFSRTFDLLGTHTITIETMGTPGRQIIAIDEFRVGGAPAGQVLATLRFGEPRRTRSRPGSRRRGR